MRQVDLLVSYPTYSMGANLTLILYFLLLLLVIVSASVLVSMFLKTREGFANALEDYKSTSGYKTAAAAVVDLADSRSNGRRDSLDMLASSVSPPMLSTTIS